MPLLSGYGTVLKRGGAGFLWTGSSVDFESNLNVESLTTVNSHSNSNGNDGMAHTALTPLFCASLRLSIVLSPSKALLLVPSPHRHFQTGADVVAGPALVVLIMNAKCTIRELGKTKIYYRFWRVYYTPMAAQ